MRTLERNSNCLVWAFGESYRGVKWGKCRSWSSFLKLLNFRAPVEFWDMCPWPAMCAERALEAREHHPVFVSMHACVACVCVCGGGYSLKSCLSDQLWCPVGRSTQLCRVKERSAAAWSTSFTHNKKQKYTHTHRHTLSQRQQFCTLAAWSCLLRFSLPIQSYHSPLSASKLPHF